jgi:DNA-directed RNA polymerase II subunit RPB11
LYPFLFSPEMNASKKVSIEYVGNVRNTIEMRIENETHTVGALLAEQLLEDRRCLFGAYRVDHPTDNHVFVRISADRTCSVKELLSETLKKIEDDTLALIEQLKDARHGSEGLALYG